MSAPRPPLGRESGALLARWGRLVHRARWFVLGLSALSLCASLWVIHVGGQLDPPDIPADTESGRARGLLGKELPGQPPSFGLIFSSETRQALDPAFRDEVERALAPLRRDPRVARVRTAYDQPGPVPAAVSLVSRDGRRMLATVELRGTAAGFASLEFSGLPPDLYPSLRGLVRAETLEVVSAGNVALNHDFTEVARQDLGRVEALILPAVAVLLLLVFGSVVAAALPLAVGALAMTGAMAVTLALARCISVSIYAPNIVSMIGLGVAIDYSLFVVSRFREEIRERSPVEALARTVATAGRAILFSGLTVAIGLLGMLFLGLGNLGSMGWAGTSVVTLAVVYGLTTLPALLAVLGPRVNSLRVPFLHSERAGARLWHRLASTVMAHPWRVFVPVVCLLLLFGLPFLHLRVGSGDATSLPPDAESRRGDELLRREFPGGDANRIVVVLDAGAASPLEPARVAQTYAFSRWLAARPHVQRVDSFVDLHPSLDLATYQQMAALPPAQRPPELVEALRHTLGEHVAMLVATTGSRPNSDEARALVREIRRAHPPYDGEVLITGQTAFDLDFIGLVVRHAPLAIGLVVVVTYVVLFLLLDSVLLPLKAIVMNLLSITASYGALVWIFQDGHLASWLDFTPGPIQTATPIIMFCLVFGLSMDYEVLLLSRVREEYERSEDNAGAVVVGLERTGRLITGAAAIMAAVFFGFGLARSVVIQAVGVGIGVAVVVDATIVRALLVPATMRLMGRWNWWRPAWLTLRPWRRASGVAANRS
ncbi:MAG: MMPL family transporter [Candidatus Rokuibacteriota bacterium]|nr:MAG: MMPL family transporter [Candidatus Rokubacteria bacterium]